MAASFITFKLLEHNTENEEFEKSRALQKRPITHITLIIIIIIVIIIIMIIIITMIIMITIIIINLFRLHKFAMVHMPKRKKISSLTTHI